MRIEQWLGSVKARIVWLTLFVAWALSFLTIRETAWLDWMGFILMFWTMYQPSRISFTLAFLVGLVMDVQQTSLLGQHALTYVWLVYAMRLLSVRLQFSSVFVHALYGTGLMLATQLLRAVVLFLAGRMVELTPMVWIFVGTVAWLLLAGLISRGAKSQSVGGWVSH